MMEWNPEAIVILIGVVGTLIALYLFMVLGIVLVIGL